MDKIYKVKVDESFEYDLKNSDLQKLDLLELDKSKSHLIDNNKSFFVELEESNFLKKEYSVKINSNSYNVKISGALEMLIKEMGFTIGVSKKANDIIAPMPGLILDVNVKEWQEVKEGETLLILEAMKMENAISAPKDGIVKFIGTETGKTVEKGDLLIELE